MAQCPDDCKSVNKSDLNFFKIQEVGWSPVGGATWATGGTWATDTMMKNNLTWISRIPSSIAPGNYVLRMEIIALQMAYAEGAEVCWIDVRDMAL
jgi:hypothetical protein